MAEDDEDEEKKCPPAGAPAWMATFSDIMALLVAFFILILSFAEIEVQKYKQLAGSMQEAFGVQRDIKAEAIPKGTSVITKEFSPGDPQPTPLEKIQQKTDEKPEDTLQIECAGEVSRTTEESGGTGKPSTKDIRRAQAAAAQMKKEKVKEQAKEIAEKLKRQIMDGEIEVATKGQNIVIRVKEKGSFPTGSAEIQDSFKPVMAKIREMLRDVKGEVTVEGHTDDQPIQTGRFRSNWELSSARAVSVAHQLLKGDALAPDRFTVKGKGATDPLAPNSTAPNRAKNRRVEIVVNQTEAQKKQSQISASKAQELEAQSGGNIEIQQPGAAGAQGGDGASPGAGSDGGGTAPQGGAEAGEGQEPRPGTAPTAPPVEDVFGASSDAPAQQ